ncbi:hypothetical protein KIL84_010166 [Mauremys mutica]|uniref:Uncharacterized protein n=1 Tax=Mauremys mutica TaxID=74926 RepID=A0A9D4AZJ5_9SAUR|nr:hypothetical protein KIL84_010166 [Mauremys mutica]
MPFSSPLASQVLLCRRETEREQRGGVGASDFPSKKTPLLGSSVRDYSEAPRASIPGFWPSQVRGVLSLQLSECWRQSASVPTDNGKIRLNLFYTQGHEVPKRRL